MAVTPNFGMPILTIADNAKLDTLFNSMTSALDTNLKTALDNALMSKALQFKGTAAARPSLVGANEGDTYQDTDAQKLLWVYRASKWFVAPGQVIASANSVTGNVGSVGSPLFTSLATPALPIGQKYRVVSNRVPFFHAAAGAVIFHLRWLNSTSGTVSNSTGTAFTGRFYQPGGGQVMSAPPLEVSDVTTVAGPVSANVYLGSAGSFFGADGMELRIESV